MAASKAHTIEQLRKVALELFSRNGFEGTSMRDVARASGASLGALQYYFPTKEALFDDTLNEFYVRLENLQRKLITELPQQKTLEERLGLVVRSCFRFSYEEQDMMRMRMRRIIQHGQIEDVRRKTIQQPFLEKYGETLAMAAGLEKSDGQLMVRSFMHLIVRYAISAEEELRELTYAGPEVPLDEVLTRVEDFLVRLSCTVSYGWERTD